MDKDLKPVSKMKFNKKQSKIKIKMLVRMQNLLKNLKIFIIRMEWKIILGNLQ